MTDEMVQGIVGLGYLALNNNQLSGSIPSSIGSLSYLHHLDLSSNQLSGVVPDSLQWLVSGANCYISPLFTLMFQIMYDLFGVPPDPPWCFTSLQLDSNRLSGTIPAWLGTFGAPFGPEGPGSDGSVFNANSAPRTLSLTNNLFSGLGDPSMFMGSQFTGFVNTTQAGTGETGTIYVGPTVSQLPGPLLYGCPPGFWRSGLDDIVNGTSAFPVPICSPCALGFVAPEIGTETCAACLVNQYAFGDGINCQPCPQNAVSLPGSPSISNCSCLYGFIPSYTPDGSFTCSQCSAGTYHNYSLVGNSTCVPCAPGTFSATGASLCTNCAPGFFSSPDNTACVPCPAGTALNASTNACSDCAIGSIAAADGAASCTLCPAGYYSDAANTRCIACAVGTFLNGTSMACSPCPAGSFTNLPAQTHCLLPPAGFVSTPQTTHASSLQMAGLSAATFGPTQNATLTSSIATTLNLAPAAILIASVSDVAARRRLAATQLQVNFTTVTSGTAAAAAVLAALSASENFTQSLASSLAASGDAVLSAVSAASITATPPVATTVFLDAQPCAAGTYLDGITQACIPCVVGTVAPASSSTTCTACPPRTVWLNASVPCFPCPNNAITSPNSPAQCACSPGFYDTLFGASMDIPVCAPCPIGGVCTTGFLAADVDWWRESTTSVTLYKCKVGKCLAEEVVGPLSAEGNATSDASTGASTNPTNCVTGNTGPLCALCLDGYAIQAGECLPCDPADEFNAWSPGLKAALVVLCTLVALLFIALAFFLPLLPRLQAVTAKTAGAAGSALETVGSVPSRLLSCCRSSKRGPSMQLPPTKVMDGSDDDAPPETTPGAEASAAAKHAQHDGAATAAAGLASSAMAEAMLAGDAAGGEGSDGDGSEGSDGNEDAASQLITVFMDFSNLIQKYSKILVKCVCMCSHILALADALPLCTRHVCAQLLPGASLAAVFHVILSSH